MIETPRPDSGGLQVVTRTAQILRLFDADRTTVRSALVEQELGIGRTSAHRYLQSMATEGLLQRAGDGAYRLGPLLAGLGSAMLTRNRVIDLGRPLIRELADTSDQTAVLGIWTGTNAVAMLCEEPRGKTVHMTVRIGAPLPLDSAQGIAFLASQPDDSTLERVLRGESDEERRRLQQLVADARALGYARSAAVLPGVGAVAVTVRDASGEAVATIATIAATEMLTDARLETLIPQLRTTADQLGTQL